MVSGAFIYRLFYIKDDLIHGVAKLNLQRTLSVCSYSFASSSKFKTGEPASALVISTVPYHRGLLDPKASYYSSKTTSIR
jgi:hypothetical protein